MPTGPFSLTLTVDPTAQGTCGPQSPCPSVEAALKKAVPNTLVLLAAGTYDGLELTPSFVPTRARPLAIAAADGAAVSVDGVEIDVPDVSVDGLTSTGTLYLRTAAERSGFSRMRVTGASVFMTSAADSWLTGSVIQPAEDSDGVQIKALDGTSPTRMLLDSNIIGPTSRGPERKHVDCIQLMAGTDIDIRNNVLFRCASQGVLVKSDAGGEVGEGVVLARNVIQLCPTKSEACDGFSAVNISEPGVDFVHNTVIDGSSVFVDETRVEGNVMSFLSVCTETLRFNLVGGSNCEVGPTNTLARFEVVNSTATPPDGRLAGEAPFVPVPAEVARSVGDDAVGTLSVESRPGAFG